jgi:hypothetical protein
MKLKELELKIKDNIFEFLLFDRVVNDFGYLEDKKFYHKVTKELIDKILDVYGENYFSINENDIGQYCYIENYGESITLDELKKLEFFENSEEQDHDLRVETEQGLKELIDVHFKEYLNDSCSVIENRDVFDIVLYTILKELNK